MTYRSRGRSIVELVVAVTFVGFLVGFITVLCVGNYFRALRAMERQRQRRLAKMNGGDDRSLGSGSYNSGGSTPLSPGAEHGGGESRHLLGQRQTSSMSQTLNPFARERQRRGQEILRDPEAQSLLLREEPSGNNGVSWR